jgi:hypothetical protein
MTEYWEKVEAWELAHKRVTVSSRSLSEPRRKTDCLALTELSESLPHECLFLNLNLNRHPSSSTFVSLLFDKSACQPRSPLLVPGLLPAPCPLPIHLPSSCPPPQSCLSSSHVSLSSCTPFSSHTPSALDLCQGRLFDRFFHTFAYVAVSFLFRGCLCFICVDRRPLPCCTNHCTRYVASAERVCHPLSLPALGVSDSFQHIHYVLPCLPCSVARQPQQAPSQSFSSSAALRSS